MKAMVMAAGLGTRLRPLTYEVPKPMVPVANRPVIELILRSLAKGGVTDVVCNLHWFPETITDRLGDGSDLGVKLTYSHEEELLNTAGGVATCATSSATSPSSSWPATRSPTSTSPRSPPRTRQTTASRRSR